MVIFPPCLGFWILILNGSCVEENTRSHVSGLFRWTGDGYAIITAANRRQEMLQPEKAAKNTAQAVACAPLLVWEFWVNYFDRVNLSYPGCSEASFWNLAVMFGGSQALHWTYMLLQLPSGAGCWIDLGARVGIISTVIWSVVPSQRRSPPASAVYLGAFSVGVGEAPTSRPIQKQIGYWFPQNERRPGHRHV